MRIAGCLLMMLLMLVCPDTTARAARGALSTWALGVVPSLFPYMVLCRMLGEQLSGTRMPPALAASVMGLLGGSPSGAAALRAYARQGRLSRKALLPLCALTGTISPAFMLNMAGGWLGGGRTGVCLLASHLMAAALCAGIVRLLTRAMADSPSDRSPAPPHEDDGAGPVLQSLSAILGVGGCIVFYSVIAAGLSLPLPKTAGALLHGLLEAAGGTHALSTAPFCPYARAVLAAAVCGFSGLSILEQNRMFVSEFGVGMRELALMALLRALLAAALMALLWPALCRL